MGSPRATAWSRKTSPERVVEVPAGPAGVGVGLPGPDREAVGDGGHGVGQGVDPDGARRGVALHEDVGPRRTGGRPGRWPRPSPRWTGGRRGRARRRGRPRTCRSGRTSGPGRSRPSSSRTRRRRTTAGNDGSGWVAARRVVEEVALDVEDELVAPEHLLGRVRVEVDSGGTVNVPPWPSPDSLEQAASTASIVAEPGRAEQEVPPGQPGAAGVRVQSQAGAAQDLPHQRRGIGGVGTRRWTPA